MPKVYVITGATSGIGKALLERLPKDAVVFAAYRSEKHVESLKEISENINPFYVDYSKPETLKGAIEYIKSKTDKVDTLVNVAGCVVAGPAELVSVDEVRRQFNVNVFGHLEMAQGLAELLCEGKIINISSMASFAIFPFISPYCASKRALDIFFNSFLIENKKNIKVVSIKPGVIATPLWDKSVEENTESLQNCDDYEKEMTYVKRNAQKNGKSGLDVERVVDVIMKADSLKNPKLSYTVGRDAYFASLISKLPQGVINSLVKLGIKSRVS